jgi:glutathione S-transferase
LKGKKEFALGVFLKLVIGNKRFSSWSLRPWLVLTQFGIPFEEVLIYLDQPTTKQDILKYSPSAKVPALVVGDHVIWDSLAICEYLNDQFPEKKMWPSDPMTRAHARSVSAEMHSSFQKMREVMPHNLQLTQTQFVSHAALNDIARVKEIWMTCLAKSNGPFLFGDFSIADAMYAPVVNRFVSYAAPIDAVKEIAVANYIKTIRELPSHQQWIQAGLKETVSAPFHV